MRTYLLLSNCSDSIVRRCEANTRDEAIEIFAEMGYYQEDYRIQTIEDYENIKEIPSYRMRGISDDCVKKSNN